MRLDELAGKIGATVVSAGVAAVEIAGVYAGDRISDLLTEASPTTLLVTNLAGPQLLRVAELMDVPAICLVRGVTPDGEVLKQAAARGVALLVSPVGMFETCGRMFGVLNA